MDKSTHFFKEYVHTITDFLVCYDTYAIGDSICDDNLNILACNYDDGDCCFGIKGVYCIACICKDEYTNYPLKTTPAPGMIYLDLLFSSNSCFVRITYMYVYDLALSLLC